MPTRTVTRKNLDTMSRRLNYLKRLSDEGEANSYDMAEIAALRNAIEFIEYYKELEREEYEDLD